MNIPEFETLRAAHTALEAQETQLLGPAIFRLETDIDEASMKAVSTIDAQRKELDATTYGERSRVIGGATDADFNQRVIQVVDRIFASSHLVARDAHEEHATVFCEIPAVSDQAMPTRILIEAGRLSPAFAWIKTVMSAVNAEKRVISEANDDMAYMPIEKRMIDLLNIEDCLALIEAERTNAATAVASL